jgi:dinuclear metal center YbgI/SA1388 family protein
LVHYLDTYLQVAQIEDVSNNGLQVEGADEVGLVALAVDVCQATIDGAIERGAQMLIVHHGLLWGAAFPLVGRHRRQVKALLDNDCSLYASHLPLDLHPEVGNNVQYARVAGLEVAGPFGLYGIEATAPDGLDLEVLIDRLRKSLQVEPLVIRGAEALVHRVAIISGRSPTDVVLAAQQGYDTCLSGEPAHSVYHVASECGINLVFGGHYATETLGPKALARHVEAELALNTVFIDAPTGL